MHPKFFLNPRGVLICCPVPSLVPGINKGTHDPTRCVDTSLKTMVSYTSAAGLSSPYFGSITSNDLVLQPAVTTHRWCVSGGENRDTRVRETGHHPDWQQAGKYCHQTTTNKNSNQGRQLFFNKRPAAVTAGHRSNAPHSRHPGHWLARPAAKPRAPSPRPWPR